MKIQVLVMFLQETAIVKFRLYGTVWDFLPKPVHAVLFIYLFIFKEDKQEFSFFKKTGHLRAESDFELNMKVLEH